ncbi:MAG TPA: hypothetical protein VLB01_00555 [Thermodesulfobacteriota bacterium]|nr:hypothetical protein [Thermodesulfobacteriota bacterium]
MGLPSVNIAFLHRVYLSVIVLYRSKFFVISLAVIGATLSFYMEEGRAYSDYNLNLSENSKVKKSLTAKKRKKPRNPKVSLEAVLSGKFAVKKRNNVNLKAGFFSGSVVEYQDRFFQNRGTSDIGTSRVTDYFKPTLSRSPPLFA